MSQVARLVKASFCIALLIIPTHSLFAQTQVDRMGNEKATQPSGRKHPALRTAPMRKPTPEHAERVNRFMQQNGSQIRAAKAC